MSAVAAGLLILLQLRLRLLLRGGSSGRGGPSSRRTSVLVRVIVLAALALWLSFTVSGLLSRVVSGPLGRLLLAPLLTWLSSWGTLLLFLLAMPTVLGALTYRSDLKLLLLTPLSPRLRQACLRNIRQSTRTRGPGRIFTRRLLARSVAPLPWKPSFKSLICDPRNRL